MTRPLLLAAPLALALALPVAAALPEISAEDRALASVPWDPGAVAVVLDQEVTVRLRDYDSQEVNSTLTLDRREKILRSEGLERANVRLVHGSRMRLVRVTGGVVHRDGSRSELPADTLFRTVLSRAQRRYVSTIAFPAVEVGAILEIHAEFAWDSVFFIDPWLFHEPIPVRRSRITYDVPSSLEAAVWKRDPFQVGLVTENQAAGRFHRLVRGSVEKLPGLATEPYGWPINDLSTQIMMVPTAYRNEDVYERLLSDWPSTCRAYDGPYYKALHADSGVAERARELTAGLAGATERARALFRFVRDRIATDPVPGVGVVENRGIGDVLREGEGDYADKTLLLVGLLDAVKIPARIVWVADRSGGQIDAQVPSPGWFDRPIAAIELEGKRVYLDTGDAALPFGTFAPGLAGMPAVLWHAKKPELVTLPESVAADNARRSRVELRVAADGGVAGAGSLELSGQTAVAARRDVGAADDGDAWARWLGERSSGFSISGVRVEDRGESGLALHWTLAAGAEDAAAGRLRFAPASPLGPRGQPFPAGARRLSPALFPFAESEEATLVVEWPQEWSLHAAPVDAEFENAAGTLRLTARAEAQRVEVRRSFVVERRQAVTREEFDETRALFQRLAEADARALTLARR